MNKLVREHYPASKLPDDLREGIDPLKSVTVTVIEEERPEYVMSFEEIFATRSPPYLNQTEVDEHLRQLREDRNA